MHQDEYRSPQVLRRQVDDHLLSKPDRLLRRFRGLESRLAEAKRTAQQVDALGKQKAALEKQVTAQKRQVAALESQLSAQTAELVSQQGQLDHFRRDADRLKDRMSHLRSELMRVRASRSMRIGRAVLWPLHATKRLVGSGVPTGPKHPELELPTTDADDPKGHNK